MLSKLLCLAAHMKLGRGLRKIRYVYCLALSKPFNKQSFMKLPLAVHTSSSLSLHYTTHQAIKTSMRKKSFTLG